MHVTFCLGSLTTLLYRPVTRRDPETAELQHKIWWRRARRCNRRSDQKCRAGFGGVSGSNSPACYLADCFDHRVSVLGGEGATLDWIPKPSGDRISRMALSRRRASFVPGISAACRQGIASFWVASECALFEVG